jgi:hypothetical protein
MLTEGEFRTEMLAVAQESASHLANIAMAALHSTGAVVADVDTEGKVTLRLPTEGEQLARQSGQPSPASDFRVFPTETVINKGTRAWVFKPPAFLDDVVVECFADDDAPLGMRCLAIKKMPGNERAKYDVTFTLREWK